MDFCRTRVAYIKGSTYVIIKRAQLLIQGSVSAPQRVLTDAPRWFFRIRTHFHRQLLCSFRERTALHAAFIYIADGSAPSGPKILLAAHKSVRALIAGYYNAPTVLLYRWWSLLLNRDALNLSLYEGFSPTRLSIGSQFYNSVCWNILSANSPWFNDILFFAT